MKNKKGFTLIELIIVIAILAIIMLIGTAAYSSIQERMKVRADKATAAQIGKAIKIRETDVGEENGIGLYPEVIEYDEIPGIGNYIAEEIKPQSMEDGNFVATAFQTQTGKKIVVGIGKKVEGSESYSIGDKVYNGKDESGWAWSEDTKIEEFLKDESVSGSISSGGTVDVFPGVAIVENTEIDVGDYIYYTPGGGTATITGAESGLADYYNDNGEPAMLDLPVEGTSGEETQPTYNQTFTVNATESKWIVIANNGGQLDIIPADGSIGDLTLYGKIGYANAIGILNRICSKYKNSTYATAARSLGYVSGSKGSLTSEEIEGMTYTNMKAKTDEYNNSGDTSSQKRAEIFGSYSGAWNAEYKEAQGVLYEEVWLAARGLFVDEEKANFGVPWVDKWSIGTEYLYFSFENKVSSDGGSNGVCPVVSLKPEIKILSGSGSKYWPYSMTKTADENQSSPA